MSQQIFNFRDIVQLDVLDGEKLKLDSILDRPIVITGIKIKPSKYQGKGSSWCTTFQYYFEDDESQKYITVTGSDVIKEQLEKAQTYFNDNNLPIMMHTKIVKIDKFYSCM